MTLLLIAYILYALLAIPAGVKYANWVADDKSSTGFAFLSLAATIFAVIALCLYLSGIGHGIVALIILLPSITSFIAGLIVGVDRIVNK